MSRKSRSVNSVDKKLEAVSSTMTADKDPLHHIELELTGTYLDSLSLEELKSVGARDGGMIKKLYEVKKS